MGWISSQEKKRILELDSTGVAIEEVYGSKRTSSFFLCLSKALIIFLVCSGTITGFCDAFSLTYNKGLVVFFIAVISFMVSMLYVNKKLFYIGYIGLLIFFTVELLRYYLYANSGFQAIMNTVRKAYGDHFNMLVVRTSEESYTNRSLTISIALIFIAVFLIIMYNITVSRYMNFAETLAISFILLEIPLYIGLKPPLFSVIITMTGCIATGLLQRGSFNRVTVPGKKAPDYIRDRIFRKNYYTTRGSHKGILLTVAFACVFSLVICVLSLPAYERGLGDTEEDSAKSAFDDTLKILVQNGFSGFFDRYDSFNGLARGALGGVSSVRPDFQTDLVVEYVPNGAETVYLRGFIGAEYTGERWDGYLNVIRKNKSSSSENGKSGEEDRAVILTESINNLDEGFIRQVLETDEPTARMRIRYIDMSFGLVVTPYITLHENIVDNNEREKLIDENGKEMISLGSEDIGYIPAKEAGYKVNEDGSPIRREEVGIWESKPDFSIRYDNYINLYTGGTSELGKYLGTFLKERDNLGLDLKGYKNAAARKDTKAMNDFVLSACAAIKEMFLNEYPYSLSPGKTPSNEDFVKYFLETQKRGYCSHYASAAALLLRYMGIPTRYVEGYCIPASLLQEKGKRSDEDGSSWHKGENDYNPDNLVYSVEVSDYYAHAWIEVYIEGKGFVPYEVTPPSFEEVTPAATGGIGGFLQRLLNVDLGIGKGEEESISVTGDVSQAVIEEDDGPDLTILIIPLGIVIGAVIVFWALFLLIRKFVKELKYSRWQKRGDYVPLVYGRYCDLVKKLKKKKIIRAENPLPMELAKELTRFIHEKNENGAAADESKTALECEAVFGYAERVLYSSSHASSPEEYEKYYVFIKTF